MCGKASAGIVFPPAGGRRPILKDCDKFRVHPGAKVRLGKWPTRVKSVYRSKKHYRTLLEQHVSELSRRQEMLYASDREALLLIFQAMDTAGKDGAIKHVMSGINPQGCQVYSFKHPSAEELDHDFLWRTARSLPERGRIGIFNRSYYEEVLVTRVHPEILQAQRLPGNPAPTREFWQGRYRSILDHEAHLYRNGTRIVKFFLHLSPQEQLKRLLERIDDPDKNWKFSMSDLEERGRWKDYTLAYEECLSETSTTEAPWYIVPADDKKNARLIVSGIVQETMQALDLSYPQADAKRRAELRRIRSLLKR